MAVWPSGYGVRLRLHFFARAWCCCWFVVRWCKVYSCCQMTAALISDFFLSERTNSSFSNFAKTPKSIRLKSVSGGIQKYPHTFHPQHNNNNMSENEGGGAAADVDFNDDLFTCANVRFIQCYRIARKFSILFLLCVLIFFFETTTNQHHHHHHHHLHH